MRSLQKLQEEFTLDCARLVLKAWELGYTLTDGEAYRTKEQAAWYAANGKGIAESLHTQRLARDFNVFRKGEYLKDGSLFADLGMWWKEQGPYHCWGGDFKTRPDGNHFSITPDGVRK